jgi:hypothetical protein
MIFIFNGQVRIQLSGQITELWVVRIRTDVTGIYSASNDYQKIFLEVKRGRRLRPTT